MGRKGENNRQRIIDAADKLFYHSGYHKTSFQDISDATNIPRGNFYYYFKTKDEILDAVVQKRLADFRGILDGFEQRYNHPEERIRAFIDLLGDNRQNILRSGCPIGTLSAELANDNASLQQTSRLVFDLIRHWLTDQFQQRSVCRADEAALDLLAEMQGASIIACAYQDQHFLDRCIRRLHDTLSRTLDDTKE